MSNDLPERSPVWLKKCKEKVLALLTPGAKFPVGWPRARWVGGTQEAIGEASRMQVALRNRSIWHPADQAEFEAYIDDIYRKRGQV